MLPIVILNTEKINSQVMVRSNKLSEYSWSFILNNITKNTYKVFLESFLNSSADKPVFRKTSSEFYLHPGLITVTEKEIGTVISEQMYDILREKYDTDKYQLSVCVRQKYGPDLGFQNIEL